MMMMVSERGFLLASSWLLFPVGLLVTLRIFISLLKSFHFTYRTHIKTLLKNNSYKRKFGEWAVVTGCTSGIGEAFVQDLASEGMNIVLISRSLDKLKKQSVETERQYGVKTKIIVCNYLDRYAYDKALQETQGIEIGLVVNNVGLNTDTGSRRFDEMTPEEVRDMIVVNGGAATMMTKAILPRMLSKNKGYIFNIGSTSGFLCLPYQSLYCATKCYMRMWSICLNEEIQTKNVTVQCSIPQFVRTGMCKGNNLLYNCPVWTCEPLVYARAALRTIDITDSGGYFFYDYMLWFTKFVNAVLRKDIESSIVNGICQLLLPHCSKVED